MLHFVRRLESRETVLVWVAGVVLAVLAVSLIVGNAGIVAGAQIAAAVGTLVLAGLAYAQVSEMREVRIAQERPQVIVDADYSDKDTISVVVRNIGPGAAKDISFEFSAPLSSTLSDPKGGPGNFVVSELPFLKDGLDYLAPGSEIRSGWDTYASLFGLLQKEGPTDGISVTSRYHDLLGRNYTTEWKIDPLKVEGTMKFSGLRKKGVHELVSEVNALNKTIGRTLDSSLGELQVSTAAERRERREDIAAGGRYRDTDKVHVKRGQDVLNGQIGRYLGDGLYEVFVSGQGVQTIAEQDLSPRLERDESQEEG